MCDIRKHLTTAKQHKRFVKDILRICYITKPTIIESILQALIILLIFSNVIFSYVIFSDSKHDINLQFNRTK